jgi:AcrR family transcriptional regulator
VTIIEDLINTTNNKSESHWLKRRSANGLVIEKAALTLFLKNGPDEVSIADIAEKAGVSRRTLFRYYRSKEEIIAAMPARQMVLASQMVCQRPANESLVEAILKTTLAMEQSREDEELISLSRQVMLRFPFDTFAM